jgi:integrase
MGLTPPTGKLSIGRHLDDWLADRRGKVRPATWISYEGQVRIHLESVRRIQLTKLRPADVRRLLRDREAAGCAPRSVAYTLTIFRMALGQAVRDGLRAPQHRRGRRRAAKSPAPSSRSGRPTRFDVLDVDDELHALWAILLGRGLRLGEALGLRWSDVDLAAGKLSVTGSIRPVDRRVRPDNTARLQRVEPKTEAGWRTMALPTFVLEALIAHRAAMTSRIASSGSASCSRRREARRSTRATSPGHGPTSWLSASVKRIRIHDARHTCVAILLGEGATLEDIKRLLGHETIATTSDLYGHLVEAAAASSRTSCSAPSRVPDDPPDRPRARGTRAHCAVVPVESWRAVVIDELHDHATVSAEALRAVLGLPAGLAISFSTTAAMTDEELGWGRVAANDAANPIDEEAAHA